MPRRTSDNPTPRRGTGFFAVDEAGVVFSESSQNLYALDPMASYCWLEIEAGRSLANIADDLAAASGRDREDARSRVGEVVASFAAADLFDDGTAPCPPADPERPERSVPAPPGLAALLDAPAQSARLRLMGQGLRVDFGSDGLANDLAAIVAPLAADGDGPDRQMALVEADGVVYGCDQGQTVYSSTEEKSAAAVLERILYRGALYETDCLLSIHCGCVGVGARDDLGHPAAWLSLPAASGSGKTTLTAALAAAGFPYGSDELLVLRDDLMARPLEFPLCVKEKSWPVLTDLYPELPELPVYERYGHNVRFLPPPGPPIAPGWRPIAAFVFPRYGADETTELQPLGAIEGMQRLFDQCLTIPEPLKLDGVGRIVDFCAGSTFHELALSDLGAAIAAIRELAATP
jgi:hypothetical protein